MKQTICRISVILLAVAFLTGCAGTAVMATQDNFKPPVIRLSHIEVQKYWGFWFFKGVAPTYGAAIDPKTNQPKPGNYGAPLDLAFIFEIENPNDFPVAMDSVNFTVAFEDFDLDTVGYTEQMWIPAKKTNQIRIHSILSTDSAMLSLMVTGGFKLKEKKMSVWEALEKYWKTVPDFAFPIYVKEGAAVFKTDNNATQVVPFTATFP